MQKKTNFHSQIDPFLHCLKHSTMANPAHQIRDDLHNSSRPLNHLQRLTHLIEFNPCQVRLNLT